MQEHEVDVIGPKLLQGIFHGFSAGVVAVVLDPDLRRQEDLLPRDAGLLDRRPHFLFIEITLRGIKGTVAGLQRVQDAALTFVFGHLIDAVAEDRHLDTIRKFDIFHA